MNVRTDISLDDKYDATNGSVFISGTQALVRLPMTQIRRDRAGGWNTAGFISGYRGSPLGAYDMQLGREERRLKEHDIEFMPAINEDLGVSAVWGTQQVQLSPGANREGVFGIWYGKSPGVDRSGDALKHANAAGTTDKGGVLCLAGDDHTCKSSSLPHQSDQTFIASFIPMLYPSSVHEFLELGLLGIEMSRFSGLYTGFKVIADTIETTGVVDLAQEQRQFVIPEFEKPPGGLGLRYPDPFLAQDDRLQTYKLPAVLAFARANKVDRVTVASERKQFGIIASGKAYEDTIEALRRLGIGEAERKEIGLAVYKVAMPWPLEPEGVLEFASGLSEILVVEERRDVIEGQLKSYLFNSPGPRVTVVGKTDEKGKELLSSIVGLSVERIATVIAGRISGLEVDAGLRNRVFARSEEFERKTNDAATHKPPVLRTPYFCAGCPHNTSTKVPEGSRALSGIGCHFMAQWMDRDTATYTHMGAEGVPWTAQSRFTDEKHVFVNLGDGTYFHSGTLAIRQAVASGANVTYKILFNDAVAMTGGQVHDGDVSPQRITHQLASEGVSPIYIVSDTPENYSSADLAKGTKVAHRDGLDMVMRELREVPGCSAIIYEQTCAAEKRRKRKRKLMPDPDMRVVINENVCEGCGDCSVQSNCVAVEPLETEFGRKRQINQSACNKDFSCLNGFCPSFVTVRGGNPKRGVSSAPPAAEDLPHPVLPNLDEPWNIAVAGVGGTGVLTIGAVIGMASHLEGKVSLVLDMAGLAQKGGSVMSHIRMARDEKEIRAPRVGSGCADLMIAADDIVAASRDAALLCGPGRTEAIVNTAVTPTAEFVLDGSFDFKAQATRNAVHRQVKSDSHFHDFTKAALAVAGDSIATNTMMLGYAWQSGLIPLELASIQRAIELNGVAVKANLAAFAWGRSMAVDPSTVAAEEVTGKKLKDLSVDELVEHRANHLTDYHSSRLSGKYLERVREMRAEFEKLEDGKTREALQRAVADGYAKLLSYKDEYETARLYVKTGYLDELRSRFEDGARLSFNFAPPMLPGEDAQGRPKKREFGPWIIPVLRLLTRLKVLRGTALDPFGKTAERRKERSLIPAYEADMKLVAETLNSENAAVALELLELPDMIRGFGPVKEAAMQKAAGRRMALREQLTQDPNVSRLVAAE